jgi:hypothetical protein
MVGRHRNAKAWRERAKQFRRLANEQSDSQMKQQMTVLAVQWEAMADEAEMETRPQQAPTPSARSPSRP